MTFSPPCRRTGSGSIGGAERRATPRSSSSASWGRASRARCAPRATPGSRRSTPTSCSRPSSACRSPTSSPPRARRSSAAARRRWSPRLLERARTAARSRSAAAACSPSGSATRSAGHMVVWLEADAEHRLGRVEGAPAAGARPRDVRARCSPSGGRSTSRSPTRSCRAAEDSAARALPALLALARAAGRDPDGLGASALGRVPGVRRPRPARERLLAAGGAALRASPTRSVGGALRRARSARRAGAIELAPGRADQDPGRDRAGAARARDAWRDPRPITSPRSAAGSSATWPASAPPSTSAASRSCRCRRPSSPRSTRPTAARRASTCRRQELRRRLSPARGGAHRPGDPARRCPRASSPPGSSRC